MKARLLSGAGLVLAVVLVLAVNLLANEALTGARLDFTENGLYTLSEGTRNILESIEEPVVLRLYLSKRLATRLPGVKSYADRVEELLRAYELLAHGKIRLEVIDPEPFSEEEDRAVGYGVRGIPLTGGDETFYFGLVGTSATQIEEVIAFFSTSREQFLEYDITKLVYQLAVSDRAVVGLLSSLPIFGANPQLAAAAGMQGSLAATIVEQMRQLFVVKTLEADLETIEEDVDVLMVVHPERLPPAALYAVDQFVMRGGRALLFVDPHSEAGRPGTIPPAPEESVSALARLLESWRLRLEEGKVVADLQHATQVQTERDGRVVVLEYPVWMNLPAPQLNPGDVVTANLNALMLASAGRLEILPGDHASVLPLVKVGPKAARIDASRLGVELDPEALAREYEPEDEEFVLAVRVTGKLESAFPDGPPPAPPAPAVAGETAAPAGAETEREAAERPAHRAASAEEANLIVIADSDMLQDRFWVQRQRFLGGSVAIPTSGNGAFVVNGLDNLSGNRDLISVRSRGTYSRPFERVEALRREAELDFRAKERELIAELEKTEQRLLELEEQKRGEDAVILSGAQEQEIQKFREQRVRIRKELRDVRHALRSDIVQLESWLKFINIGLVPLLIAIGGAVAAFLQLRRRRRASVAHA